MCGHDVACDVLCVRVYESVHVWRMLLVALCCFGKDTCM